MVWAGRFGFFLTVMKVLVGLMFVSFLISAWALRPDIGDILRGIALPTAPSGSVVAVLSVLGGVGGSLSVMCYGYWIREAGREGGEWLRGIRIDLGGAYLLTGFFGVAVMILGAQIRPEAVGIDIVLGMADRLETALGPSGGGPSTWVSGPRSLPRCWASGRGYPTCSPTSWRCSKELPARTARPWSGPTHGTTAGSCCS